MDFTLSCEQNKRKREQSCIKSFRFSCDMILSNKNDILLWKRRLWIRVTIKLLHFQFSPRLIGWNVVIPFHKNLCQQCHMIPCAEVISSWPRCHNIFFVPWNQIGKLANFKIIDIDFNLKSSILSRNGWKMYHQVEWVFFIQV